MFILAKITDVIKVAPHLFDRDPKNILIEEIDRKYSNKVIVDLGLCVTLYDFSSIGDGYIHPSDGTAHTEVSFRMVVFSPTVGEIVVGRITSCNEEHIRVSTEFSQDIIIPSYAMLVNSYFDIAERLWVWKYVDEDGGEQPFFMDLQQPIRFRVTRVNYTRITKTEKGIQATTTETMNEKNLNSNFGKRRSSSVDLAETDPRPSAFQIIGSINEDGLGLTSWWNS